MIDVKAMKKEGLINFALTYKINELKKELDALPKGSIFRRDSLEQEILKYEKLRDKQKKEN